MANYCFLATMWIMMTSCMALLVTAGTQSVNAANAVSSDSCAHKTTQQQQQQQPQQPQQPILQHQQQQFSSNPAPDLYSLLDKINYPSKSQFSTPKELFRPSLDISDPISKFGDANGLSQNRHFYLNSDKTQDLLYANGGNTEPNAHVNGEPFADERYTEISELSAPYFLGKFRTYPFNGEDMPMSEEKKSVPLFVGKRDQSNVFTNAEHFFPNNLALWNGIDFPANYMAETPKITKGRMSNGSILNLTDKRGAPKFVGKRISVLDSSYRSSDETSILEHKRGAPRFVGKRGVPYFVGKRWLSHSFGQDVASLENSANEFMNLQEKIKQLKGLEVDDSAYYPSKRGAPKFVGKRVFGSEDGHFEERRGAPKFVGRSAPFSLVSHEQPRFGDEQSSEW